MRREYDEIISIGEKCFIAQSLIYLGVRNFSSPFDWCGISNHGTGGGLVDRINLILNNFKDFFCKSDFIQMSEGGKYLYVNTRTNLQFRHEFDEYQDDFDAKFEWVAEKYNRRIKRFLDVLSEPKKKILLVYSSSLFPLGGDRETIINKVAELNKKFPADVSLLVVDGHNNTLPRNSSPVYKRVADDVTWVSNCNLYKAVSDTSPEYYIKTMSKIIKHCVHVVPKQQNIISLTTFPARIHQVHNVINSLLNQSVKPDKIVLYLSLVEFPNRIVPPQLDALTKNSVFEIRFVSENFKSYKKLVHALADFSHANIITVDDDIIYPKNMLSQLLRCHARHPKDVCANRIRTIKIEDGAIAPYSEWQLSEKRLMPRRHGYKNFFCGAGGVLYPPKSLHPDVLNNQKFMKLCPNQDDVWFWAMAVLNKRKISVTRFGYNLQERTVAAVQSVGLWNTINSATTNPNNTAIANVINEYPAIAVKLGLR